MTNSILLYILHLPQKYLSSTSFIILTINHKLTLDQSLTKVLFLLLIILKSPNGMICQKFSSVNSYHIHTSSNSCHTLTFSEELI